MSHYEKHNLETQALPFIFRQRIEKPIGRFGSSNWHENLEILHVISGDGAISNNGHVISVSRGDVVVFNHNHLHALAAGESELRYNYLIVDRAFCLSNGFDTNKISFEMQINDERVREYMEELQAAYFLAEDSDYRSLLIRSLVLRLMYVLCKDHGKIELDGDHTERTASYVKEAIAYIRASYDKDFSLEDVANFVGVNKCYLSREFHKYTGYSFVAYVNRTRCKMACDMLVNGHVSICEVGVRCGFQNKSYFAKNFKRYIGMLPGEYREKRLTAK